MLSIHHRGPRLCDGIARRELLRAGGLGLFGLSWAGLFSPAAKAAPASTDGPVAAAKAKRCIVLFLMGGPPQHSTWDPKPQAPAEVRGEFGPIDTVVPGMQIGELLPMTARLADKICLLRAVATNDNAHSSSGYAMLTGQPHQPLNVENANPGPPNDFPNLGAVVGLLDQRSRALPPAMRLPMHIYNTDGSTWPGQDAGFLGRAADPWLLACDPASPEFRVPHFSVSADVADGRMEVRRSLLAQLDKQFEAAQGGALDAFDYRRRQAFDLLNSPQSRTAFDLTQEPAGVRDRYGRGQFGQSVLLARRLVEAGVALVQVNWFRGADEPSDNPCWDSHTNEADRLRNVLMPPLDLAYSALLEDLGSRGMLEETLVVCIGEFGRTPKFNPRGGRDHWGYVFSAALAGGGVAGGQAYGASDQQGAFPREGLVRPGDLTATILHLMGHDPETEIHDRLGRPMIVSRGDVLRQIL